MQLPDAQVAVLEAASPTDPKTVEQLADETGLKIEAATGAAFALEEAGLVDVTETTETTLSLTDEGRAYAAGTLPEHALYGAVRSIDADGGAPIGEAIDAAGLDDDAVEVALANYARKGLGEVAGGEITTDSGYDPASDPERAAVESLAAGESVDPDDDAVARLDRRGLVDVDERTVRHVVVTDEGVTALMEGVETAETVDRLTPAHLTSGEWRDVEFAEYNVSAEAGATVGGKHHPLRRTAERVKDVLVGMGFEEMQGPHVDADFYINDCLFMPQDHPARTHWDRFALEAPAKIDTEDLPADLVEAVERAHREGVGPDGEGYHSPWDEEFARALALRGHTTSLSVRHLAGLADADLEPPERYFSIEKGYRNDTLDATHLLEFFQIEGWVMADDLSVRDLMGTFTEFYEQFGITDIEFKPHYNPYTEPSFELFGRHPETGELIEIGNSGVFRPEMLDPLGVEADVMAWGLALERLYMLVTGAEDIRDVHGTLADLEFLRTEEVTY